MNSANHYEFLQISPNADPDTIHRVYRFLAVRLHPDNPDTGDADKFFSLKQAYDVLSDPIRRAEYDAACGKEAAGQPPLSSTIDFMDNMEGELNRRLAVLALLYARRRANPDRPEVSLYDVEMRMGFPRDYLDFTIWYLLRKGYITRADNAELALTVAGVDFVETKRVSIPILNHLLTSGAGVFAMQKAGGEPGAASSATPGATYDWRIRGDRRVQPDRKVAGDRRKPGGKA